MLLNQTVWKAASVSTDACSQSERSVTCVLFEVFLSVFSWAGDQCCSLLKWQIRQVGGQRRDRVSPVFLLSLSVKLWATLSIKGFYFEILSEKNHATSALHSVYQANCLAVCFRKTVFDLFFLFSLNWVISSLNEALQDSYCLQKTRLCVELNVKENVDLRQRIFTEKYIKFIFPK